MQKGMRIHILRVFVNDKNEFGNPVGIIVDEKHEISFSERQSLATQLGFSESVFINNIAIGNVSIFNPKSEVDFAGQALIGAAYFITNILKKQVKYLECNAGRIATWRENDCTWIGADLKKTPPWNHEQLQDASQVSEISISQTKSKKHTIIWSWISPEKGIIRARTFAPDWGITEDEANGSGSMQLASLLGQKLEIHHGKGSVIFAKPGKTGFAQVGGRVKEDTS